MATGATAETLTNILQQNYLPGIEVQVNNDFPNLRYIRQNSSDISAEGLEAVIAMLLGYNEGGSFHGESADVADSGYPIIKRARVNLKQLTFRARLTYRLMRLARTNAHSFARSAQIQMSSTREAFVLTMNQYLWGDGSGVQCRVKSETLSTDNKMILDRAYALDDGGAPASIIRPGQKLHLLDTKGFTAGVSADRGVGFVAAVDDDTGTEGEIEVTIRDGYTFTGVVAGDYVYLQNTIEGWTDPGESQDNRPAMGMLGFYDETLRPELQGLDVADEPQWAGNNIPVTQTTVIPSFRRAKNRLPKRKGAMAGRGGILYLISSYETHERFVASGLDDKVEFRNVRRIDGDWDVAVFDGRPWFMDHTAPDARTFFVPRGGMIQRYAVTRFVDFVADGPGRWGRVPNKTVFDALLTAVYEYGIRRRNVLTMATGMSWDIFA